MHFCIVVSIAQFQWNFGTSFTSLRHTHHSHQDALQVQARVQPTSQWFPRALNAASISKSSANHKAPLKTVHCN